MKIEYLDQREKKPLKEKSIKCKRKGCKNMVRDTFCESCKKDLSIFTRIKMYYKLKGTLVKHEKVM